MIKKREKIVIRSDKILLNELYEKRLIMDGIFKMRNDWEINVLFLDCWLYIREWNIG